MLKNERGNWYAIGIFNWDFGGVDNHRHFYRISRSKNGNIFFNIPNHSQSFIDPICGLDQGQIDRIIHLGQWIIDQLFNIDEFGYRRDSIER